MVLVERESFTVSGQDCGLSLTEDDVIDEKPSQSEKKKDASRSGKAKKKVVDNRWTGKNEKQAFAHPWLLTSYKGHTGTILDMNFSSHGKYLTSCGDEDPERDGLTTESSSGSSSSSECNKENSRPPSVEPSPKAKGLSRRQKKNRRRENSPPSRRKTRSTKRMIAAMNLQEIREAKAILEEREKALDPLRLECNKLNISEWDFARLLQRYLLCDKEMTEMGYPMACKTYITPRTDVIIYKDPYAHSAPIRQRGCTKFDVNAREFVPKSGWSSNDSGRGSSSDSGDSEESGSSSGGEQDGGGTRSAPNLPPNVKRRTCSRCGRPFLTDDRGYVTQEKCCYHWGRAYPVAKSASGTELLEFTCCQNKAGSRGCTYGKVHVWDGLVSGRNGPFRDFIRTVPSEKTPSEGYGVYALDCEMCYTVRGLELTKVTVVAMDGRLVYESFVKPPREIVDYNTRFSGITAEDLSERRNTKTLRQVQVDLMRFISLNTILIGHGLENDLRALKIVHRHVVDTAKVFPHFKGLPFKRSLRSLASTFLRREIQRGSGTDGHNSYEDAYACMELMLRHVSQFCVEHRHGATARRSFPS
ncbi:hypothetical protein NQ318_017314 [Aromia moschata]|uniref:Exonuclease domain-containing protein n=1 Tax=Aromia moschata TaxID=1265417 RepID=A0AAV8XVZ0_9CUCU|nr:hypothetical protein NQ318_017314 [Aromia moschata]